MKNRFGMLTFIICLGLLPVALIVQAADSGDKISHDGRDVSNVNQLRINEIMASNNGVYSDTTDGNFEDWFEIYNPSTSEVELQGLYLTDDPTTDPTQYQITQSLKIPAKGFLIIWADNDNEQGPAHANFALAADGGETVAIIAADGVTPIDQRAYAPQDGTSTESRIPDGSGSWVANTTPTPGTANAQPPVITDVTQTPQIPGAGENAIISAKVSDADGTVDTVTIFYEQSTGGGLQSVAMTLQPPTSNNIWTGNIPGQANTVVISYYITAEDNDNLTTTIPEEAPSFRYGYEVGYEPVNIRINEFMAQNNNTLPDATKPMSYTDWVELYNPSTTNSVSLSGLYLTDDQQERTKAALPPETIPPGGFLVLYLDGGSIGNPVNTTDLYLDLGLSDDEDLVIYGGSGFYPIDLIDDFGNQQDDVSEGRLPNGVGEANVKFKYPTPGYSNVAQGLMITGTTRSADIPQNNAPVTIETTILSTFPVVQHTLVYSANGVSTEVEMTEGGGTYSANIPGFPNNTVVEYYIYAQDSTNVEERDPKNAPKKTFVYAVGYEIPKLVINEFMAETDNDTPPVPGQSIQDPDEPAANGPEYPDWIEIYNYGTTAVSLNGLYLTDDLGDSNKFEIPAGLTIQPGAYAIFYADDDTSQGAYHTNFALSGNGEEIGLYGGPGGTIEIDSVSFMSQTLYVSEGRLPNGSGDFTQFHVPTPGGVNVQVAPTVSAISNAPTQPFENTPVTVQATVNDDSFAFGYGMDSVTLFYTVDGGPAQAVAMSPVSATRYSGSIPGQAADTVIQYYIRATDVDGVSATSNPRTLTVQTGGTSIYLPLIVR